MKFCPQCSAFYGNEANSCPEDGVELKRTHDPYLGRTIAARYRLVKRLGSGGMSTVYLAHHVMIERFSALKILREDLSRHATHRERFLREARAVNRINHPNIVEISDLGEADGVAYLVMEYVDGPSLHQEILKNGAFPWQRAVRIALQVAGALARAHQMGVIHRDLKPENILLPRRPADTALSFLGTMVPADHELVKLTDFGIAKIMDEPGLTMSEQLFGTPGYIAPEFLEGHESDPRSDLYSLGVILYEMTTGVLPYDDRGASLLTAPLRSPPIPPSQRIPAYFADLEDLVLHLLAREPERRPPDAFAVYDALVYLLRAEAQSGPPVLSTTPSATRISYESQVAVRPEARTMVEPVPTDVSGAHPRQTSDLTAAAAAGTVRWHDALARLESAIEVGHRQGAEAARIERAAEVVSVAHGKLLTLERVSRAVCAQQDRVDALEADGRVFRDDFGRAIDQLVRDRSHERVQSQSLSRPIARGIGERVAAQHADIALWETALLAADGGPPADAEQDLSFQIDALQRSLQAKNVALEADLVEASGALEGSLAAIRHLTHELRRLVDEAGDELRDLHLEVTSSGSTPAVGRQRSWRP